MTTKASHKKTVNKKIIIISIITTLVIAIGIILLIVLLLKKTSIKQSYLIANGEKYSINTSGDFCTTRTDDETFDFTDCNKKPQSIAKDQITEIHLTDLPRVPSAPNNYLQNLCYDMTNLTIADIQIPNTINSVGTEFCDGMLQNCSKLVSLPDSFNIPQGITSVGNDFCAGMFANCLKLVSLPNSFNLPQNLTSIGDSFCQSMFLNCYELRSIPLGFDLPQNLTSIGAGFCTNMFINCSTLKNDNTCTSIHIPSPSLIQPSFCRYMFHGCSGLTGVDASPTSGSVIKINAN